MASSCAVLIVEDDEAIRAMLADVLAVENFAVRTAPNGEAALAMLESWRPDLIVLDLEMPSMDGRSFRARQRSLPGVADIPVIVLSGAADLEAQFEGLQAAEMLPKPCDLQVLVAAIRRVVQGEHESG